MSLQALSTELQQTIIGYLDFISLLNLRKASTTLRDLVNTSLSKQGIILPARAKLLELYLELSNHPHYRLYNYNADSEEVPFCAAEYLSTINAQISQLAPDSNLRIPVEFEHWVLEWPKNEALGWFWLGEIGLVDNLLPLEKSPGLLYDSAESEEPVGLYVSSHGCQDYTTLFFEGLGGKSGKVWKGDICEMGESEDWEEEEEENVVDEIEDWEEEERENMVDSWTDWLRKLLRGGAGE